MEVLDSLEGIEKLDKSNMLKLLLDFPQQCKDARDLAMKLELPESLGRVKNVVTTGMGGSAIGGDILRSLFSSVCSVPIVVNRNYTVPGFVDEDTLFIAASYSGNTEETLSAFSEAVKRKSKIVSISSGGQLESLSREMNIPHFLIPENGMQPRCAFGYLFIPMMIFLSRLGFIPDQSSDMDGVIDLLSSTASKLFPSVPTEDNQAKQIAQEVFDKLPVIYASQNQFDIVAMRWKGQFNENAKMMAFYNVIPEMNHNEIVGWGIPENITRRCVVIFIYDDADFPKIKERMNITRDLIAAEGVQVITVQSQGRSPLARALYSIYLGDFASYYLAILNGVDPTPISRIDLFKSMLGS